MLPPSTLDRMPDAFVALWQGVEDEILKDIARRIAKTGTITETANWQLWRYQQTEALRSDVVKLLAKYSGKSDTAIRQLLLQAATEAMEREDAIYYHYGLEPTPFEESAALNNLLDAGARQTAGTWKNLTATTANTVTGQFERTLDAAWAKVSTGAFDYKTAVKQAVDSLADGMKFVTYPTGHTDTLEVAARRAVLTGVNQTGAKLQVARADEMGVEFFETTAHGGARPSHAEWQGRQFHRGGAVDYMGRHYPDFEAATGYGTGAGLCGWNCRHTFFAIFPELGAPPAWTQESLEALNARDIEYNGGKYTRYEISQMQRARERNVRRWKKRYLAETAAGVDTTDAAVRLKAARRIAVIGPMAQNRLHLLGAWSAHGREEDAVSLFAGLENEYRGRAELFYARGCDFDGEDRSGFREAVAAAAAADVVVLCLGEKKQWSGENASRSTIALPEIQEQLAAELAQTGKPLVLVLSSGRPLELCRLEPLCGAMVQMWQPGIRGGNPLAGILSGRINPSGRLAMTFPRSTGQIPIYYNRRQSGRTHQGKYQDIPSTPLYEFGHGLSYTTFEYGDLRPSATTLRRGEKVTVEVSVTNTGGMDGAETVHWFISDPVCRISRPVRELKHFEKQPIRRGETRTFRFEIDPEKDLSFTDGDGNRFLEPGDYFILVKDKKVKLTLTD